MNHFVVMGVASCGKSTVAEQLSGRVGATMIEADELHGRANIEKMQRGEALCDDDRWPWLIRVATQMRESSAPVFVSCSALRRVYRQCLLDHAKVSIGFIHLHADKDVIATRMSARLDHFMPLSLLESQFQTLEMLHGDETGIVIDIAQSKQEVIDDAMKYVVQQRQKTS